EGGSAGERGPSARAAFGGGTSGGRRRGAGSRAVARKDPASGAIHCRAFDLGARGGGSTLPQRRGARSDAAPSYRGCGARAEGVGGRSCQRCRGRGLEGIAPGFSVPTPLIPT